MPAYDDGKNKVTTRTIDYRTQVRKKLGKRWKEPEVVYEFSGGRKFKSTDHTTSGIYGGTGT